MDLEGHLLGFPGFPGWNSAHDKEFEQLFIG
jgi:hypothetical protein